MPWAAAGDVLHEELGATGGRKDCFDAAGKEKKRVQGRQTSTPQVTPTVFGALFRASDARQGGSHFGDLPARAGGRGLH